MVVALSATPVLAAQVPAASKTPTPALDYPTAARFLEQATFGPTAKDIATLQKTGFTGWFAQQLKAPISKFPNPPRNQGLNFAESVFIDNAMNGQDQLRQRMAFTLGQIWVVSGVSESVQAMMPFEQLLQNDAFVNYRQIMQDITLTVTMGEYLNMINNQKADPSAGTSPNENYAREIMQLFTIGTVMLNNDGSLQTDSNGNPIPTYDETTIQTLARVFTGWTYPSPKHRERDFNPYPFPMVVNESEHDTDAKTLFGNNLPAGQTAQQDLQQALDILFNHQNVPPFVALRVIQHFVSSNPSPAYISRIASVFIDNGSGVRGDMGAVIEAALTDPEARAGDDDIAEQVPTGGHLREPVLYTTGILRALGAQVGSRNQLSYFIGNMGQDLLAPGTVFNYYTPFYQIPQTTLTGPEFQLLTPATAIIRANFLDNVIFDGLGKDTKVDLKPFIKMASDVPTLMNAVDLAFTRGQMPDTMKDTIIAALNTTSSPTQRAQMAIYLTATSGFYQVEH
ncbi:MAG TPA: DUF1800 family protein [Candidatus Binataceae bacterium]|nr:DUF1800 family protein [Candidatus Binataceae bacterium]